MRYINTKASLRLGLILLLVFIIALIVSTIDMVRRKARFAPVMCLLLVAYLEKSSFFYYQPASFYTIYHDKVSNSLSSNEDSGMFLRSLKMILKIYEETVRGF